MTEGSLDQLVVELDEMLAGADAALPREAPASASVRQPVHTVYLPVDRVAANGRHTIARLQRGALDAVESYAPDVASMAAAVGWPEALVAEVWPRVQSKLDREPIEDLRLDLEDGYGLRADDVEDAHARAAAAIFAEFGGHAGANDRTQAPSMPFSFGVRIKSLESATRRRALRSLDLVVGALAAAGGVPNGFVITLPKVTSVDQVRAFVHACAQLESTYGLPAGRLHFEVQVETPQAILGPDGTATVAALLRAADGRCTGLHFGTYDYSASLGIAPAHQSMDHPAADHAKAVMQVAAAGVGVAVADGSTNLLPVGDRKAVNAGWELHARLVTRSLERGFYQGWDLHPAQLPSRYLATYAFYRQGFPLAASRLASYARGSSDGVLDEPATAFALASFLWRGIDCGALDLDEVTAATAINESELARRARRRAEDDPRIRAFNALPLPDVLHRLLAVCSSPKWAETLAAGRPFASEAGLHACAESALESLAEQDIDEALASHPRIGEQREGAEGVVSQQEQAGVVGADAQVLEAIAAGNRAYEERFSYVYLVCATGHSASELLDLLWSRLRNDPATERGVLRQELAKINALRLKRLLADLEETQ